MALINCPECGKEVSSASKQCINCGFPINELKINSSIKQIEKEDPNALIFDDIAYDIGNIKKKILSIKCSETEIANFASELRAQINGIGEYMSIYIVEYIYKYKEIPKASFVSSSANTKIRAITSNLPKCPTCGSTNLEKISDTKKVVGALAFGLLSKNARSQFKCKNCGYKW